jgi:hypothetical protein
MVLVGTFVAVSGCWMISPAVGLVGTGLTVIGAARVLHAVLSQRRRQR